MLTCPLVYRVGGHPPKGADVTEQAPSPKDAEEGRQVSGDEPSNGLGKPTREVNGAWPLCGQTEERGARPAARTPLADGRGPLVCAQQLSRTSAEKRPGPGAAGGDLDFELSSDSESSSDSEGQSSSATSDGESGERRGRKKPKAVRDAGKVVLPGGAPGPGGAGPSAEPGPGVQADLQGDGERDGLCGLAGGGADRKEAETESQNSEQSGITVGESLDQSVEEEEEEEDADADDHLVHLEEILARVHSDYYARYDRYLRGEAPEAPDIRKIVPELKSRVLADVAIIFSGLHPTNFPVEKTREHYHATALGAKILTQLVLDPDAPDRATHLIAARAGKGRLPSGPAGPAHAGWPLPGAMGCAVPGSEHLVPRRHGEGAPGPGVRPAARGQPRLAVELPGAVGPRGGAAIPAERRLRQSPAVRPPRAGEAGPLGRSPGPAAILVHTGAQAARRCARARTLPALPPARGCPLPGRLDGARAWGGSRVSVASDAAQLGSRCRLPCFPPSCGS